MTVRSLSTEPLGIAEYHNRAFAFSQQIREVEPPEPLAGRSVLGQCIHEIGHWAGETLPSIFFFLLKWSASRKEGEGVSDRHFARHLEATKLVATKVHVRAYLLLLAQESQSVPFKTMLVLGTQAEWPWQSQDLLKRLFLDSAQQGWAMVFQEHFDIHLDVHLNPKDLSKKLESIYREELGNRVVPLLLPYAKRALTIADTNTMPLAVLLDTFEGRVERIDSDGIAHVTFEESEGQLAGAEIDAHELAKQGIGEGDRFVCEIKGEGLKTTLTLARRPERELTDEDYARIGLELEEEWPKMMPAGNDG